mmetsp:Transcript_48868/g.153500  ORF Transcript_48868/g.153500 Transcript_48868/m.153500 type:complete len:308 (-) Transcript_48868:89-1012(-)
MCEKTSGISVEMLTSDSSASVTAWNTLNAKIPVKLEDVTSATRSSHGQERMRPVTPPYAMSREFDDGEEMDWKALYLREAEKNKQLLQWIIQLQSTLNHGLQMIEPSKNKNNNPEVQSNKCPKIAGIASLLDGSSDFRDVQRPATRDAEEGEGSKDENGLRSSSAPSPGQGEGTRGMMVSDGQREGGRESSQGSEGGREQKNSEARTSGDSSDRDTSSEHNYGTHAEMTGGKENSSCTTESQLGQIELARTRCCGCGQGFAFCASFLSPHDFLVMPCPKCRTPAAIPPSPLAPTQSNALRASEKSAS